MITLEDGSRVINLCANNYLGLANSKHLSRAAIEAIGTHGYGMASVRFICGTQSVHKQLETRISTFLGTRDTILYSSCWDANGGLFETILGPDDAIISDSLNHASIIDGVRLCKAARYRYANNDMADLEDKLKEADGARFRLIATDGVFSMDGVIANLPAICDLADEYGAIVMVDDSHAVGFIGDNGGGTPDYWAFRTVWTSLRAPSARLSGGIRWLYVREPRTDCATEAALETVSVLQFDRTNDRRCHDQSHRPGRRVS